MTLAIAGSLDRPQERSLPEGVLAVSEDQEDQSYGWSKVFVLLATFLLIQDLWP